MIEVSELPAQHHILSVLVQNRPGVLARVASLFARRGFNIYSLAVAPAEHEGMSRITIVVDVESSPLEQITKQLFKLIEVVKISELDPRRCVERELLLATVRAEPDDARPDRGDRQHLRRQGARRRHGGDHRQFGGAPRQAR